MSFLEEMKETLNDEFNYSVTENGALGYRTTGKALLDLNFNVASLRDASNNEIVKQFMCAFYEDKVMAIKWLFYARDAREGVGERRLFRVIFRYLCHNHPLFVKNVVQYIPMYGRWDDLLHVFGTAHEQTALALIKEQLELDLDSMKMGMNVSLLGKWLPSYHASSEETDGFSRVVLKYLGMTQKEYRKMLSSLRKYIDVVEVKMSARRWDEIEYSKVPSRANLIYNGAFLRNDTDRRSEFLTALEKGETKINASVLFPHDIVHKYGVCGRRGYIYKGAYDATLEELWKALPDTVKGNGNTIVVADGSGSMTSCVGKSEVTMLEVADAMAIYFAERSSGQFKNKYITFSSRPQLVDFDSCQSLKEKIEVANLHNEVANTNVKAVFELILATAVLKGMKQDELPENILIISDMEFDACGGREINQRLFQVIASGYEQHGYKMPRLIFWNVGSRTKTIPIIENDLGVALVSGFSPNIIKMVMSNKTDPYECLMETLNSERYQLIENALRA